MGFGQAFIKRNCLVNEGARNCSCLGLRNIT